MAEFHEVQGAERINRDDRMTAVWVWGRYEEGNREEYMPLVTATMDGMDLPYGYSWTFGRWQQRQKDRQRELLTNIALALLLVFAVMAGLFESIRQAIAQMIAIPLALSGAGWALWITGTDLDMPAVIGLLLLIGIVLNNGIVLI